MARRGGATHVVTTTRQYKNKVYRTHLLRRSYREDGKVKNETVGNLSHLPDHVVDIVRRALKGESLVPADGAFEIVEGGSRFHGHVDAVLTAMKRLGLPALVASRASRQRDLVIAMVAARILEPQSKLATTRWWSDTTLAEMLDVGDADEDDLYEAMDWLLDRQRHIEKKLAARHLDEDGLALYDLTSSYFEGVTCPLAAFGHNRDGKKGKLQVNYGLLTNRQGIPVSVSVFEGNSGDPKTLLPQVDKVRKKFGIERFVLVGDRGMLTQKQVDAVQEMDGVDWIGALRPEAIKKLIEGAPSRWGCSTSATSSNSSTRTFPASGWWPAATMSWLIGELIKRQSLLDATVGELDKVRGMVERGRLRGQDKIGVRVGKVLNKYKVGKHFELDIRDDAFDFHILEDKVAAEAALDGIYVVRTSLPAARMDAAQTVRSYKLLSQAERAFRSFKTVDLMVRPIRHRTEHRVRAHIFLCMLAYYVLWHMIEAWRPLLFADEDQEAKAVRDPVAPAKRSEAAMRKVHTKRLDDGSLVHSIQTLLGHLAAIVRNTCRCRGAGPDDSTFDMDTTPDAKQRQALDLLKTISL